MEEISQNKFCESLEAITLNIPSSKPPPNSEEPLPFVLVGDEAFPLKKYLLRPYPGVWALNDDGKQICIYRLLRASRVVENSVSILNQKFRLFYDRIQLSPENAEKVVLAACVLQLLKKLCQCGRMCECKHRRSITALLCHNISPFRWSASEEAMRVRKKYRHNLENAGSVYRQLETISRGGKFQSNVINHYNIFILKWVSVQLHCILKADLLRNKCNSWATFKTDILTYAAHYWVEVVLICRKWQWRIWGFQQQWHLSFCDYKQQTNCVTFFFNFHKYLLYTLLC